MVDTCYPNFMPLSMDEFERHLYLYYGNGLNPSLRIYKNFNPSSAYTAQEKDFLKNDFGRNSARRHKKFRCHFCVRGSMKFNPSMQVVTKLEIVPVIEAHLIRFSFLRGWSVVSFPLMIKWLISKVGICG